jgi:hypothetical protein
MPIPNVSTLYQRISQGAEGGHEFARFIKLLLGTDYSSQRVHFIPSQLLVFPPEQNFV